MIDSMTDLVWFSPTGEHYDAKDYDAKRLVKEFYHEKPEFPADFLYYKGWARLFNDKLVLKGISLAYRDISDETFKAINKYVEKHFKDDDLSNRFKTDWGYEAAFH